jgi:hypothetical protein
VQSSVKRAIAPLHKSIKIVSKRSEIKHYMPNFSTIAILCETKSTGNRQVSHPIMKNNQLVCGADTKEIGR